MKKMYYYKVLRVILPLIGLLIGGVKMLGLSMEVELFARLGFSDAGRIGFGAAQAVAGLFIWIPAVEVWGIVISAALLAFIATVMATGGAIGYAPVPLFGLSVLCCFYWLRKASFAHGSLSR